MSGGEFLREVEREQWGINLDYKLINTHTALHNKISF